MDSIPAFLMCYNRWAVQQLIKAMTEKSSPIRHKSLEKGLKKALLTTLSDTFSCPKKLFAVSILMEKQSFENG
ncbi:TPA: hypothetical protein SUB15_001076 [Streptococcus equi subsp. zooepidemicus]|nr:hypothetical protein [Streptococcus equi subsp. zooepidemicus]